MKSIQKQLCCHSDFIDIVRSIPDTRKYNFLGSVINRILCVYENAILQEVISVITNTLNLEIAVLMFDGLMIYGTEFEDIALIDTIEEHVNTQFQGLNMIFTIKEHSNEIIIPDDYVIPTIEMQNEISNNNPDSSFKIANNDKDASHLVWEYMKDIIMYSNGSFYYKKDNVWIQNYNLMESDIREYIMNANIYKSDDMGRKIEYCNNRKNADNVAKTILDRAVHFCDNLWETRVFRSSHGKVLFNNGYYDFKEYKFYMNDADDFDKSIIFTEKIAFDCKMDFTDEEITYKNSIKQRMFYTPFGEDVGNYYVLQLARGLAGDCMKRFLIGMGPTNTGKSVISNALKSSCGGYHGSWNGANIAYKNNSGNDEAQKLRWVKLLKNKRIITSNEITMGLQIDGNMIKKISNGGLDDITARGHCENETQFQVGFLPILFCQDMDKITPKDDAVINRVRAINYEKSYVENPSNEFELQIDVNMSNEIATDEFKIAFLHLLFDTYKEFHSNGRIEFEPTGIKQANADILGADVSIIDSFKNDFEITNDESDYTSSKDIETWLKAGNYKITMTKFGLEMKKYLKINNLEGVVNKLKKVKGKPIQVWYGIKLIEECDD
jgi:hypothetical protein